MAGQFLSLWKTVPAPLFGALGAIACGFHLASHYELYVLYITYFDTLDRAALLNFAKLVLVDLTILIMAISFVMRTRAIRGPQSGYQIVIALLGSAWPLVPFVFSGLLSAFNPALHAQWMPLFMEPEPGDIRVVIGLSLMLTGNSLDVWGYATLYKSFSLVPEARKLITSGPYRYFRHPIYLGHFITQAGLWLFLATLHGGWLVWYGVFLWLQVTRIQFEESVLEAAFADDYRRYKQSVWWFGKE